MIILALIPSIVLLCVVWLSDRVESEPVRLLLALFAGGAVSFFFAALTEQLVNRGISRFFDIWSTLYLLIKCFLILAMIEEVGKYAVMRVISWKRPAFNYTFDAIVYAVVTSLGFATVENVLYLVKATARFGNVFDIAFRRGVISVPAHMIFGIFMGYLYGRAKCADVRNDPAGRRLNSWLALIVPVLLHGLYDYLVNQLSAGKVGTALFACVVLMLTFLAIRDQSLMDKEIKPKSELPKTQ